MALSKLLELHVWLVPNINYSALHYSTGYVWHLMIGVLAECYLMLKGKMPGKNQKKTLNKIGSETSMKKHWKNVCVNYLQNVKFRVKKKVSAFGSRPCFATTSMKMMMKIASTSLFSCFDKKEEDLISLRYMNQGLQNCMTNFFCANLVTLVAFLRRTMQNYSSLQFCSRQKKRKLFGFDDYFLKSIELPKKKEK